MLSRCPPGLLRQALLHDLHAAINRIAVHGCDAELRLLSREQLFMYLDILEARPGSPEWALVESILGHPIPTPTEVSHARPQ